MIHIAALAAVLVAVLTGPEPVQLREQVAHYGQEVFRTRSGAVAPPPFLPTRFAGYRLEAGDTVRIDQEGIPSVVIWSTGKFTQNPTTVAQWGLGAYARGEFATARKASDWLLAHQSSNGGYPLTFDQSVPGGYRLAAPWYSAITQGNAISLLVRMWQVDDNPAYLNSAKRAFELLEIPVDEGGLQGSLNGGVWFEGTPDPKYPNHILNISVFALLGIHDLATIADDPEALSLWNAGEASLRANLGEYQVRAPFHPKAPKGLPEQWAVYDLQVNDVPAVPNYIDPTYMLIQCELLEEMAARTGRQEYARLARTWRNSLSVYPARR